MNPNKILHFTDGADCRLKFIDKANRYGIGTAIPYGDCNNPYSIEVFYPDENNHRLVRKYHKLIKHGKHTYDGIVFDTTPNALKSHVRINPNSPLQKIKTNVFNPHVNYGHTAVSMGTYYNYPTQQGTAPTIAIISLGGTYLTSDLVTYWSTIQGLLTYPVVTYVNVDGTRNAPNQTPVSGDGSDENTLDIQISGSLCPRSKIVVYFGQNTLQGFYNAISRAIYDNVNHPKIISISWGAPESAFGNSAMTAYDQLFAVANTRGIQICVASGDNGATDGSGSSTPHLDFPSSSPHVIACGGTTITGSLTESVWSWNPTYQWGTGGGVSSLFPIPTYQVGIVTYPTTTPSTTNLRNKRASPDVALNADPLTGWTIYFNGQLYLSAFGGTSCVAPALAGLLGLMNLTYPTNFCTTLYSVFSQKTAFRDITTGNNDNINRSTNVWKATTNYDMCTGLGSLRGVQLLTALKTSHL